MAEYKGYVGPDVPKDTISDRGMTPAQIPQAQELNAA